MAARLTERLRVAVAASPVPLPQAWLAESDYNQTWERVRRLGRALGVTADAGLMWRPAERLHQADLNRARAPTQPVLRLHDRSAAAAEAWVVARAPVR